MTATSISMRLIVVIAATLPVFTAGLFAAPPSIYPTTAFQHQAVDVGTSISFTVTATGDTPLSFQWVLDGRELAGQTNRTIAFRSAQSADEGDYTVVVTNVFGAVTSNPARLWVVPPAAAFIKGNFTNALGRLPYLYLLPTNYTTARTYPLWFNFHGTPGDETVMTTPNYGYPGYFNLPGTKTFVSYRQQEREPVILLWPTRRAGDEYWTDAYLRQASAMLDQFIAQFTVDTNRIFICAESEGVHAAWDVIAMRPGFFAAAGLAAGWQGSAQAASVKDVPVWAWCARDDDAGQLGNTQAFVSSVRRAGANLIYTEYATGGHLGGILMGFSTPPLVDWFLAQRRGMLPSGEPFLAITSPTPQANLPTGATNVSLAGTAAALGQAVSKVTWQNTANNRTGTAFGANTWNVTDVPLVLNRTNLIILTATTTSWSAGSGGNTTFNDTLAVIQAPIRAMLSWQGTNAVLNWTGGGPPFSVQLATDFTLGDWTDRFLNVTPPVTLSLTGMAGFYRIVGQ